MRISKSALTVTLLAFGAVAPIFAVEVDYSTTGTFSAGVGNVFAGTGGATLTFNGIDAAHGQFKQPPTTISLGVFHADLPVLTGPADITPTGTFTLTVYQTSPCPVGPPCVVSDTPDVLSGQIYTTEDFPSIYFPHGSIGLTFNQTSFVINGVTYALQNLNNSGTLYIGAGNTSVESFLTAAQVTNSNPTPEPTFFGLVGLGIAGLAVVSFRSKRAA